MIEESELAEFKEWKRTKNQTQLDAAFYELTDLMNGMGGYNITMPSRAFRVLSNALILLKKEVCK